MYHSVVEVKLRSSFSKLSFKVVPTYTLPQSSDMLNKNTLAVKKVRGQSEGACKQAGVTKRYDIT